MEKKPKETGKQIVVQDFTFFPSLCCFVTYSEMHILIILGT